MDRLTILFSFDVVFFFFFFWLKGIPDVPPSSLHDELEWLRALTYLLCIIERSTQFIQENLFLESEDQAYIVPSCDGHRRTNAGASVRCTSERWLSLHKPLVEIMYDNTNSKQPNLRTNPSVWCLVFGHSGR